MITINRNETLIFGSINGHPFSVHYDAEKFHAMKLLEQRATVVETMDDLKQIVEELEPLTKESYKEIVETASPYLFVNRHTNKFYLQYNGVQSSKAIPQAIADRILISVEKGIDIMPLIKCWVRFLRCPNYSDTKAHLFAKYINATYTDNAKLTELINKGGITHDVAHALSTTPQVAITLEGLIVGYKVSEEVTVKYVLNEDEEVITKSRYTKAVDPDTGLVTYDKPQYVEELLFRPAVMGNGGDEFWCVGVDVNGKSYSKKGHYIRVGAMHYLENWDQVDCDDSRSCVKGMHIGGLSYIKGYQNEGTVTHNVLIDPMDIGAVCDIHSGDGAMRVRRYFVHSSFAGVNKNIYHSSKYAAMNDEEYRQSIEEVVKATAQKKEEADNTLAEAKALL